jgi:peptide/nickel transport system ATP-binding protein
MSTKPILRIEDLTVLYRVVGGDAVTADGVWLDAYPNETLGIAGESGCGKSTLVEGILRLLVPPGMVAGGKVWFEDRDLLTLTDQQMRLVRWQDISYIPQGSMNSLNPVLRIEAQMLDAINAHEDMSKDAARRLAIEALGKVGLPADLLRMYPHQLSGGMKQRTIIATSLLLRPKVIIADEPTTALDVVAQKAVLQTLAQLRDEYGMTVVFVSHELAAHAQIADRIAVMYAGEIVEVGTVREIFHDPLHPYTKLLIASIPSPEREDIKGIPGLAPNARDWPSGCRFHPRCPVAVDECPIDNPPLELVGKGRRAACHLVRSEHDHPAVGA